MIRRFVAGLAGSLCQSALAAQWADNSLSLLHGSHYKVEPQQTTLTFEHASRWYLGLEYDYWNNKYGIKHSRAVKTDQNALSLMMKFHY